MQATFHWLRIETFCYATEKEELVSQTFRDLVGTDEFQTDVSESEHGNQMLILQHMATKQREMDEIFSRLGKELLQALSDDLENRIDEDCVFYTRLDKQRAVCGEYRVAHHGDVISITGKVASNPARKEVAMDNMTQFLKKLIDRE
ncbi:MAG: exosome protein [Candidatus Methanomethylophilus sp.]|jgi:RNA binding exosome subunit|nr:exosome protein [Methanomethylophilus sp.]